MKPLIMQFSPTSYYFIPLGSKCSPQHAAPCSQILPVYVLPLMSKNNFHTKKNPCP
jgi:hypothetical protein